MADFMEKLTAQTAALLEGRFGKDSLIALATTEGGAPRVRVVNAYYENGAFYVLTHAQSGKMRQLGQDPRASVAGEWFTAQGEGASLGFVGRPENQAIAARLREAFAGWLDNGHADLSDENTCILRIQLTEGVLFSQGTRFDIDFTDAGVPLSKKGAGAHV